MNKALGKLPCASEMESVEMARSTYSSTCTGTITVAVTVPLTVDKPDQADTAFCDWVEGEWHKCSTSLDLSRANNSKKHDQRLHFRSVKHLDLSDEGLTLSGLQYKPPAFLWSDELEMRDCLRGHFDVNVHSYKRRPRLHAVEGMGGACISILPSFSGGFMLTHEALNKGNKQRMVLCLNKSLWRDRLTLEPGMELDIGCGRLTLEVKSITGEDRQLMRYSAAAYASARKPKARKVGRHGTNKKENGSISFGDSMFLESGKLVCTLDCEESEGGGVNLMTSNEIWADQALVAESKSKAQPLRNAKTKAELVTAHHASTNKSRKQQYRPTLTLKYSIEGGKTKVVEFSPRYPNLDRNKIQPVQQLPPPRHADDPHPLHFSIGGDPKCDITLPDCEIKVVAIIMAFENVFTLVCPHIMSALFQQKTALSAVQQRHVEESSIHLVLDPEKSLGLHDGDTIVVRSDGGMNSRSLLADTNAHSFRGCTCCSGIEMTVQLHDPTERHRASQNRARVEAAGIKLNMDIQKKTWVDKLGLRSSANKFNNRGELSGQPRDIENLAVEVRAPVRISKWDGSCNWLYGATEVFALKSITYLDEASIGSSPKSTISIKDPRMGHIHAQIYRKSSKGFLIEAAKSSGKRSVLNLVAASTPPGLAAPSTPPHLLLTGEVFCVGASDFHVVGFTKQRPIPAREASKRSSPGRKSLSKKMGKKGSMLWLPTKKIWKKQGKVDKNPNDISSSAKWPANDYISADRVLNEDDVYLSNDSSGGYEDSVNLGTDGNEAVQLEEFLEAADESIKQKLNKRVSIALVRHLPNVDEDEVKKRAVVTHKGDGEDEEEMSVTNNVDKSFGLALISEYNEVLKAFGLDEDTRGITYPLLRSFLIIQCIKGPLLRRLFLVKEDEITIGSSENADICVANDPLISALHCRIVFNPVECHWRLVDAQSRTGTFLRMTAEDSPLLIQPGQRFLMGNSQVRILAKTKNLERKSTAKTPIRKQFKSMFFKKERSISRCGSINKANGATLPTSKTSLVTTLRPKRSSKRTDNDVVEGGGRGEIAYPDPVQAEVDTAGDNDHVFLNSPKEPHDAIMPLQNDMMCVLPIVNGKPQSVSVCRCSAQRYFRTF